MYGYIYKITNKVNNKIYIGKHKHDIPELDCKYVASGTYINRSIRTYGIDNFTIELIDVAYTVEELNDKEIMYIDKYDSIAPNGYNLTHGGDGLLNPSQEVRDRMSKAKLGTKRTEESKLKASAKLRGIKKTPEWVEKVRASNRGKKPSNNTIEKSIEVHRNSKWYNNGTVEIMLPPNKEVPVGFVVGRLKNPFPNCSGIKKDSALVNKVADKKRGSSWYNNGSKEIMVRKDGNVPSGFVKGRKKRS